MNDETYIVGSSWLQLEDDSDLQLDEAVFEACSQALRDAGLRRHQVGLSVTSSLDLYDARSISSALTAPAAAGYFNDELRVEGDASAAFLVAAAGLASNQTDVAIIVAVNAPEVGTTREPVVRELREHVSSYTFDPHRDRPIGMTALTTLGMHAAYSLDNGTINWNDMVRDTAADINRGSQAGKSHRGPVSAEDVANSPVSVAPLTELMLPAASSGIGAMVIASGVVGRRSPNVRARLAGWGTATGPATTQPAWLTDPAASARLAASAAYKRAGISNLLEAVSYLELTDLSPSLTKDLVDAMNLGHLSNAQRNLSGGVRSNHPGIANGLLRLMEASNELTAHGKGARAVVHAADDLMGLVSSTTSVLVLESL
jgi:hypothetical protein